MKRILLNLFLVLISLGLLLLAGRYADAIVVRYPLWLKEAAPELNTTWKRVVSPMIWMTSACTMVFALRRIRALRRSRDDNDDAEDER